MLFDSRNALSTIQHTMDVILSTVRWHFALVYLNDILIILRSPQEHIGHVRKVLKLLRNAGVTLKWKKSKFFLETIDYSGQAIRPRRLEIASHTTEAIRELKEPTNIRISSRSSAFETCYDGLFRILHAWLRH